MTGRSFFNKAFVAAVVSLFSLVTNSNAQDVKSNKKDQKEAEIRNLVQSKQFVFVAQSAAPLGRRTLNLTSIYDLRLSPDTLVAELPYFGRAYVAPIDPTQGGINFTSTNFAYTINDRKKGGWDITLLPKDAQDVRQMFLTVSQDGYATLQVTSNNRQPINFNGYVTSKEKFK